MTKSPLPSGEGWSESIQQCNLHGLGVLITRPLHQAQPLYNTIKSHSGNPVLFPTIEITSPKNLDLSKQQLENATAFDDLIFISPNAVSYAIADIAIDHQRIFSIGGATANMLQQHHIPHYLPAGKKTDSESLLASPLLMDMHRRKVLIIRGNGGRSLLGNTLKDRGATVEYAEVYQRRCPDVDATSLLQKWPQEIDVVIATSNAIIDNLLHLCKSNSIVLQTPLAVISQRMQRHAEELGFQKIAVSPGTTETELLLSLCQLSPHRYDARC